MTRKRKICVVITTRGNYAKMKSVVQEIVSRQDLELQLVVGGAAVLESQGNIMATVSAIDGVNIDRTVHYIVEGGNPIAMTKSASLAVNDFATVFETMKPTVVVLIADRYETLAIAMAATYMNVPIAHIEGGETSGSIDESIRHAVTKLAHLHFPATEDAAERIIRLGEKPDSVKTVGATSLDVISELDLDNLSDVKIFLKTHGFGASIDLRKKFLIVIQHPVTTEYENNLGNIEETIAAIDQLSMPTIWISPNVDAGSDGISQGIRRYWEHKQPNFLKLLKEIPMEHYGRLLSYTSCLIGNSSSGIRESAFVGTPVVNVGTRQASRQRCANVVDVNYDREEISVAIKKQLKHGFFEPNFLYGDGKAGRRIATHLGEFSFDLQKLITY